jgi:hypothetical protein
MLLKFSGNYLNNFSIAEKANERFFTTTKNVWSRFGASIIDFFKSYKFKEIIFTLKMISVILSILLVACLLIIIVKSVKLGRAATKIKKNNQRFLKIEKKLISGQKETYKLAILEADALYDDCLKILGYEQEKKLSNFDEIKKARQVKKQIIDNNHYALTKEEAEKSISAYKHGLRELGAL